MKVLLVSSGSGSRGGGEIYLKYLASGLINTGCDVAIYVPAASVMDEFVLSLNEKFKTLRFNYTSTYNRRLRNISSVLNFLQIWSLVKCFRKADYDLIHINQQVAEDGLDLLIAASLCGKPFVSTIHVGHRASKLKAKFGHLRDLFTVVVFRLLRPKIICVCKSSLKDLTSWLSSAKGFVVLNGVERPSSLLADQRESIRSSWGCITHNEIVLGTVGRIEAQKNPLKFLSVCYSAAKSLNLKVKVVWIGDGALRYELFFRSLKYSDHIELVIDGWREDASSRMGAFDVFLLPSVFEGLPLALLEAMHVSLPVVASNCDGIAEVIDHSYNGMLCSTDDEWTSALRLLIGNVSLRNELARNANRQATKVYTCEAMGLSTYMIYQSIISNHIAKNNLL